MLKSGANADIDIFEFGGLSCIFTDLRIPQFFLLYKIGNRFNLNRFSQLFNNNDLLQRDDNFRKFVETLKFRVSDHSHNEFCRNSADLKAQLFKGRVSAWTFHGHKLSDT